MSESLPEYSLGTSEASPILTGDLLFLQEASPQKFAQKAILFITVSAQSGDFNVIYLKNYAFSIKMV